MRKIFATFILTVLSMIAFSQSIYISTEGAESYKVSTNEGIARNSEYVSMFIINEDASMIRHITDDMKSTYYVQGKELKTVDGVERFYMYVLSDAGNEYTMVIDKDNRIFFTFNRKEDYVLVYAIKNIWRQ